MGELREVRSLVLIGRRCYENLLELYGSEVVETALLLRERGAPFGDEFLGRLGVHRGVHLGRDSWFVFAGLINFIVVEI